MRMMRHEGNPSRPLRSTLRPATAIGLSALMAVALSAAAVAQDSDPPPDPEEVARRCVEHAAEAARQCNEQTAAIAAECIEQIAQYFQQGDPATAQAIARECIERLGRHTLRCTRALHNHCRQCLMILAELGAPDSLIDLVLRACREATGAMRAAGRAAITAVENAVDVGIAHACAEHAARLARNCAEQNAAISNECVQQILALLAEGRVEEAQSLARECIGTIRDESANCLRAMQGHCLRCIRQLDRRCANEELIALVLEACESASRTIVRSARIAIRHIREALPPPGDDGSGE